MKLDLDRMVRENVKQLIPYSSARGEFTGEGYMLLDANENPYGESWNRYPDPRQEVLKKGIAQLKSVQSESIFLGNGSDEVIDLIVRALCEPYRDEIISTVPTFGMFKVAAQLNGVTIREIDLDKDFQPQTEAILGAVNANTKILFLCSPNNPTGNLIEGSILTNLIAKFPGLVVVDEAYIDFAGSESSVSLLTEHDNLMVLQTFSKAWGLAGIRLGVAYANPAVIEILDKIKTPYNINSITQEIAMKALEREDEKNAWVDRIITDRNKLSQELSGFGVVKKVYPSDANFLLVQVDDALEVYQFLQNKRIIVRDRSKVKLCENSLRITVGTDNENLALINAIRLYQNEKDTISG